MNRLLYLNNRYRTYDRRKYELLSRHFELTVLWINPFPPGETPSPELLAKLRYRVLDPDRLDVVRPSHLGRSLRLAGAVRRLARDADLVLSSTSDSWKSKMAFLGARAAGRPIAFRKETWLRGRPPRGGLRSANAWLQDRLTRAIERRSAAVLVGGSKTRDYLVEAGLPAAKILPFHYLHDDLRELPPDPRLAAELEARKGGALTFLYLGRILPKKGLDVLVRAFRRLADEERAAARLWVAGEALATDTGRGAVSTPYHGTCRELARGEPRIEFLGAVDPHLVHCYYRAADVFVHPHVREVDGRETHEGWGNVITEAASLAKPVITTDRVASAFDVVRDGENGFLLPSRGLEDELLAALRFFLSEPTAVDRYGAASRAAYERSIDAEASMASLREVFDRVGGRGG